MSKINKVVAEKEESRKAIKETVNILGNVVKSTLGPKGSYVMINRGIEGVVITKDGVSVADNIPFRDPIMATAYDIIKQAANKTLDKVKDGTTTSTVFMQYIYNEAIKEIESGRSQYDIASGLKKAADKVIEFLESSKVLVTSEEQLVDIASVSCNNDKELGKIIGETFYKLGPNGMITVENSNTYQTKVEMIEGAQFEQGLMSPYLINQTDRNETILSEPLILLSDKDVNYFKDLIGVLEYAIEKRKNILLVVPEITDSALAMVVANNRNPEIPIKIACVKTPEFGNLRYETLEDLAALTGADVLSENSSFGWEDAAHHLGSAKRAIITMGATTIIEGKKDKDRFQKRLENIEEGLKVYEYPTEKEKLEERKARLTDGIAVIKAGASTDAQLTEMKDRLDDAINATRAAFKSGVLPGGGIIFLKAKKMLEKADVKLNSRDEELGYEVMKRALEQPFRTIAQNAEKNADIIMIGLGEEVSSGYDFKEDIYCDMFEQGVIDPLEVSKVAFINGHSVASMLLRTNNIISLG